MAADRIVVASVSRVVGWLPFALPAAVLFGLGFGIAADGLALDAAVPLPNYMVAGASLPPRAYRDGAEALARTDPADGNARIMLAEANLMAGAPRPLVERQLSDGLAHAPANVRGWTLLSEVLAATRPSESAQDLGVALMLAPYDFYLSGRRVRDAAMMWDHLDPETRRLAQHGAEILSSDPKLRTQYDALLATGLNQRIQSMVIQNVLIPDLKVSVGR